MIQSRDAQISPICHFKFPLFVTYFFSTISASHVSDATRRREVLCVSLAKIHTITDYIVIAYVFKTRFTIFVDDFHNDLTTFITWKWFCLHHNNVCRRVLLLSPQKWDSISISTKWTRFHVTQVSLLTSSLLTQIFPSLHYYLFTTFYGCHDIRLT